MKHSVWFSSSHHIGLAKRKSITAKHETAKDSTSLHRSTLYSTHGTIKHTSDSEEAPSSNKTRVNEVEEKEEGQWNRCGCSRRLLLELERVQLLFAVLHPLQVAVEHCDRQRHKDEIKKA